MTFYRCITRSIEVVGQAYPILIYTNEQRNELGEFKILCKDVKAGG